MRRYTRAFSAAALLAVVTAIALMTGAAGASTTGIGNWEAYPGQAVSYETTVQQPINVDGTSNFKASGKAVIPVKFSLKQGLGAFVFESIASDTGTSNDYSFLSFTPSTPLLFKDVTSLVADYTFTTGNCHGGSLRWSVRVSATQSVFIYYGGLPNFTDCTGLNSQTGLSMIGMSDLRYDTSQVGGTFYDTYAHAVELAGALPIVRASLVLDSGWGGDQRLTLASASVNGNTYTPDPGTALSSTCSLPANARIKVKKVSGSSSGDVNEPITIQPNDDNGVFRVVDCKLMYNLATSSLSGAGTYSVSVVIDGVEAANPAVFDLR
jgi:hypothetical protein